MNAEAPSGTHGVTVDRTDPAVPTVWLDRPARSNALTGSMAAQLRDEFRSLIADDSTRAIVVTGRGKAFCAGADLELVGSGQQRDETAPAMMETFLDVVRTFEYSPVPVIAAVNGAAVGGGMALAVAADIRVASPHASFHVGTIRVGLTGGEGGLTWSLPRMIGSSRAMELLVTGRRVDAFEAASIGLVSSVSDDAESCLARAHAIADSIRCNGPAAVRLTKQLVRSNQEASFEAALAAEATAQRQVSRGAEFREASTAFIERRRPSFAGEAPS